MRPHLGVFLGMLAVVTLAMCGTEFVREMPLLRQAVIATSAVCIIGAYAMIRGPRRRRPSQKLQTVDDPDTSLDSGEVSAVDIDAMAEELGLNRPFINHALVNPSGAPHGVRAQIDAIRTKDELVQHWADSLADATTANACLQALARKHFQKSR